MISEPNPPPDGRALTWAAEQLGVPPESAPEVCTSAFLRRLAEEDFVPPPPLRQAWEFAARKSSDGRPALPWLDSAAEEDLSDRVEEFAGQFFNLPPEQRLAIWERLYADARRWPRLETRLRELKPGLAVEFAPLPALRACERMGTGSELISGNPGETGGREVPVPILSHPPSVREDKLIQWIRELFPLPLDERAQRRRQMLRDEVGNDIRPWQKAARRVRRRQRAIAALAPDLLVPLATWSQQVQAASRNRQLRKIEGVKWWRPIIRSGTGAIKTNRYFMIFLMIFGGLIAHLMQMREQDQRLLDTPVYSPPNYQPSQIDPDTLKRFNDRQMSGDRVEAPPTDPEIRKLLGDQSTPGTRDDSPPADPPQIIHPESREFRERMDKAYESLKNNGEIPDQSPSPSAQSPSDKTAPPDPPAHVPASPAGPNR